MQKFARYPVYEGNEKMEVVVWFDAQWYWHAVAPGRGVMQYGFGALEASVREALGLWKADGRPTGAGWQIPPGWQEVPLAELLVEVEELRKKAVEETARERWREKLQGEFRRPADDDDLPRG